MYFSLHDKILLCGCSIVCDRVYLFQVQHIMYSVMHVQFVSMHIELLMILIQYITSRRECIMPPTPIFPHIFNNLHFFKGEENFFNPILH